MTSSAWETESRCNEDLTKIPLIMLGPPNTLREKCRVRVLVDEEDDGDLLAAMLGIDTLP